MKYSGIDVSELQNNINWNTVSSSAIRFAMIRATYGSSGVDSQFLNNIKNISKTSLVYGAYHESNAQNTQEAVNEANHFMNTIKPYRLLYPLALKIENEVAMQKGKNFFTDIILSFINTLKENNYYPIIFANIAMLNEYIDTNRLAGNDIWLSELIPQNAEQPTYNKNVTIWQYSNHGNIPGISGKVNLDTSFVDYPTIIRQKNLNNLTNINPNQDSIVDFDEPIFYTVQKGDNLRSISKKLLGDPEQYKEIMELNGLTRPMIFVGQTLRIPATINSDTILYRVKPGENLWKISENFLGYGPQYNEIMQLNGLTTDMVYPGQIIKIPVKPEKPLQTYTVKQGDNLWQISKKFLNDGNKYIDIMKLNGLKNGNLKVGQILTIPEK